MKNIFIYPDKTVRQAMKLLNKSKDQCLIVLNREDELLGTITDGDVRRGILSGSKLSDSIKEIYNSNPSTLIKGEYNLRKAKSLLSDMNISLIPVVDSNSKLVDFVNWDNVEKTKRVRHKLDNVDVIIMAGGKGTRLDPFTKVLPKPLIPIEDQTIIERIINSFKNYGCDNFYLTVNYKKEILKAYLKDLEIDAKISFVEEPKPLGTAGSLNLFQGMPSAPFFVINCDIIIKANLYDMYQFHLDGKYDMTVVASTVEHEIPYGVCIINDDGNLSSIKEKPSYDFLINTGLYILNPNALSFIPDKKFYHITHLMEDLIKKSMKVGVFPINEEHWIDIGQWSEYKKATTIL